LFLTINQFSIFHPLLTMYWKSADQSEKLFSCVGNIINKTQ